MASKQKIVRDRVSHSKKKKKSKPQDLILHTDGSVTGKDQSGWDFTAKQGATTIHEDSAAFTVSTTHALRWIASRDNSQTTHAIIVTDSMSLLQKVKVEERPPPPPHTHTPYPPPPPPPLHLPKYSQTKSVSDSKH